MNKYHNVRVGDYDSKKEAKRAQELSLLQRTGAITGLVHHPRYRLDIGSVHICVYESDFQYVENGQVVVEDVKGVKTPVYRIKKKLMKAIYKIDIKET